MKRRKFFESVALTSAAAAVTVTGTSALLTSCETPKKTKTTKLDSTKKGKVPDWAKSMKDSDMLGLGPDGKPDPNYKATGAGHTLANVDHSKPFHMKLTQEEQDILDGKKGDALGKVMKTVVAFGNAFGATHLVDLGGAPHSSVFNAPPFMKSIIDVFNICADEGLKTYAPFTLNPRPFDLYNVQTSPKEMEMVFGGYPLQPELDQVLMKIGARGLNSRSCACYVSEIGNAPPPETYVAWAESSAVNFGNSVLGIRTNRNAGGMELLCALVGKAPYFGLMTDEGRMATWIIDVQTTKEPDWGVLGAAIGIKVVEDVPYIIGIDKYFGGEVTKENMHKLKAMGSSTAANGAVGLYHVDGVTPDAKKRGKELLVKDYQTYVVDDAEIERIYSSYPNLWSNKNAKPNLCFIGCPHNTFHEILTWGQMVTKELKKRGLDRVKMPMHLFVSNPVRDHLLDEHPLLVRDMKRAGMSFTNMCAMMFTGLKGYNDDHFAVTNSNKSRKYSSARYFPDDILIEIVMTGEIPAGA